MVNILTMTMGRIQICGQMMSLKFDSKIHLKMSILNIEVMERIKGCQWPWSNFLTVDHIKIQGFLLIIMISA